MARGVATMDVAIQIPAWIIAEMVDHALRERPIECCGLLAGRGGVVSSIFALENEANSETEYLAARGLFEPFRAMRAAGEELLAIYHSHPASCAIPSRTDLARNLYPDTIHVIISLAGHRPVMRAFLLQENSYVEIAWKTVSEPVDHPWSTP